MQAATLGATHMDFATKDLVLAIIHHLLVFSLAGIVAYEIAAVRSDMTPAQIRRVGRVDLWYGILAAAILAVGFVRANFAGKGWEYYSTNHFFWAKIGTFALVGLLSIYPTIMIIRWRRNADGFASSPTRIAQVSRVRRFLWLEAVGLGFIVAFAAAMARGYGSL